MFNSGKSKHNTEAGSEPIEGSKGGRKPKSNHQTNVIFRNADGSHYHLGHGQLIKFSGVGAIRFSDTEENFRELLFQLKFNMEKVQSENAIKQVKQFEFICSNLCPSIAVELES